VTPQSDDQPASARGYDLRMLWRLLRYLRPYRLVIAAALAAMLVGSVAELAQPWMVQQAIDRYFPSGDMAGLRGVERVTASRGPARTQTGLACRSCRSCLLNVQAGVHV